jgi:RNA polymerase sigma factor (sigma-70 family)
VSVPGRVEDLLRTLAPQAVGALTRRHGRFDLAEDAVQEALVTAASRWRRDGVPEHPRGWLLTVSERRLVDELRREGSRRRREEAAAALEPGEAHAVAPGEDAGGDDTLTLLLLCCHPELTPPAQLALTLRAVGGLTTAEVARALLLPEATVAQRISRAKHRIRETGTRFALPPEPERGTRLGVVLQVLYLVFNEGYVASSGPDLHRAALTREAIRLVRELHARLPGDGEVAGLLALMLLTDARRAARTDPDGALVPLERQDRLRWDGAAIEEGVALVTAALRKRPLGPYQLQAAIAAVHAEARSAAGTDWPQVLGLYEVLERLAPNPVVTLNKAVALGMARGPRAGLALLDTLERDPRLAGSHRLAAVRGDLLERAGDRAGASAAFAEAARRADSLPEQRFLAARAAATAGAAPG